jgi:hypothetical protein
MGGGRDFVGERKNMQEPDEPCFMVAVYGCGFGKNVAEIGENGSQETLKYQ